MSQKPNATHTLGLEIESSFIKGAQLSVKQGRPCLDRLYEIPVDSSLASDETANSIDVSDEGRTLNTISEKYLTVTSLQTQDVLIRSLELKLKKISDIDKVLAFQVEPILPYPIDHAVLDRIIVSQSSEGTQLTVLAARKDHLKNHLDKWKTCHIEPEVVTCIPASLTTFSHFFCPTTEPHFIVHLSESQVACVLVRDGKLIAAQALSVGLNTLYHSWKEDLGVEERDLATFDFDAIESVLYPKLTQALLNMRQELTRVLYALSKQIKGREISVVLFTGEGVKLNHLITHLNDVLKKELLVPVSNAQFALIPVELQRHALAIGNALSALPKAADAINFRQDEFTYPHPWRRYLPAMVTYLLLSFVLSGALYILGNVYVAHQEDNARQQYVALLHTMHKSYPAFEKEYLSKTSSTKDSEENGVIPVEKMTQDDLLERLVYLEKELKGSPDSFPLQPNTPRVSDVLAWLSAHPNVVDKDANHELLPLLQIESFNYTLVKRPELKKKQDHYQVKVEIEFTSQTPKNAREFHDALIAPNDIVDPKGEVKWSTSRGRYRTSFFLKDRTVYTSN